MKLVMLVSMVLCFAHALGCAGIRGDGRWISDTDAEWGYHNDGGFECMVPLGGEADSYTFEIRPNRSGPMAILLMTDTVRNAHAFTTRTGELSLTVVASDGSILWHAGGPLAEWRIKPPSRAHLVNGRFEPELHHRAFAGPEVPGASIYAHYFDFKAGQTYHLKIEGSALRETPQGGPDGLRVILKGAALRDSWG